MWALSGLGVIPPERFQCSVCGEFLQVFFSVASQFLPVEGLS